MERKSPTIVHLFTLFLFLFTILAISRNFSSMTRTHSVLRCPFCEEAPESLAKEIEKHGPIHGEMINVMMRRRVLVGSEPPDCTDQCGGCTPCVAVLVPVIPDAESYPEAWKCECQNG